MCRAHVTGLRLAAMVPAALGVSLAAAGQAAASAHRWTGSGGSGWARSTTGSLLPALKTLTAAERGADPGPGR